MKFNWLITTVFISCMMAVSAKAQSPDIISFPGNGQLMWTNSNTNLFYQVQWAPSLVGVGSWQSGYSSLVDVQSTNPNVIIPVPMFYRVSGSSNRTQFASVVARTGQTPTLPLDPAPVGSDGALQKGAVWPSPRFTDQGDGTVLDKRHPWMICKCFGLLMNILAAVCIYSLVGCGNSQNNDNLSVVSDRIKSQNYTNLLESCRTLMPVKGKALSFELQKLEREDVDITIYPSYARYTNIVPKQLRDLDIRYVGVNRDFVILPLNISDRRLAVLAFRDGAKEFGTEKLINGLWYWTGKSGFPKTYVSGGEWGYAQ